MKQQTLRVLSVQQLQQYKRTLKLRILDLHSFQIELRKQNADLKSDLQALRIREQQKPKKVDNTNFNFDDLYKMSKNKVSSWMFSVNKETVKNTYEAGKNKVRDVANGATQLVRKSIATSFTESTVSNENRAYDIKLQSEPQDFRSYQPNQPVDNRQMKRQEHIEYQEDSNTQKLRENPIQEIQNVVQKENAKVKQQNQQKVQQIQEDKSPEKHQNLEPKSDVEALSQIQYKQTQFKNEEYRQSIDKDSDNAEDEQVIYKETSKEETDKTETKQEQKQKQTQGQTQLKDPSPQKVQKQ